MKRRSLQPSLAFCRLYGMAFTRCLIQRKCGAIVAKIRQTTSPVVSLNWRRGTFRRMRDFLLIGIVIVCSLIALRRPVFGILTFVCFAFLNPHSLTWGMGKTF